MKATGIVRRIDDLGRVVIPKEIRRTMRIREGDPLEIYTEADGEVIFKKYSPIGELTPLATQYAEVLFKSGNTPVLITDNDHVIAAAGISKREVLERRVSQSLEELMERRSIHVHTKGNGKLMPVEGLDKSACVAYPIISAGDVTGSVLVLELDENELPSEAQIKLAQVAAAFLGKQMEE